MSGPNDDIMCNADPFSEAVDLDPSNDLLDIDQWEADAEFFPMV